MSTRVKITEKIIEQGKSLNGGWNTKQIKALGETMSKGWMSRLLSKEVSPSQIDEFLELKDSHIKNKKGFKPVIVPKGITLRDQYTHPNWQRVRLKTLERDDFVCKMCGDEQETLHVHHLRYVGKYIWDTPNKYLVTVCHTCHQKSHKRRF